MYVCIHVCKGGVTVFISSPTYDIGCDRECVCMYVCMYACEYLLILPRAILAVIVGVCVCMYVCMYTCEYL